MSARESRWLLLCFAIACRFGGPSEDPTRWQSLGHDAAVGRDAGHGGAGGGVHGGSGMSDAANAADAADGHAHDASIGILADASAPGDPGDASSEPGSSCTPATPPTGCDPVHDTGCESGMQCDVDVLQSELAGVCAFSTQYDAGPCTSTGLSESCLPKHTCVFGLCNKLCYCDADCDPGECCTERLDPSLGWTLCAPCP